MTRGDSRGRLRTLAAVAAVTIVTMTAPTAQALTSGSFAKGSAADRPRDIALGKAVASLTLARVDVDANDRGYMPSALGVITATADTMTASPLSSLSMVGARAGDQQIGQWKRDSNSPDPVGYRDLRDASGASVKTSLALGGWALEAPDRETALAQLGVLEGTLNANAIGVKGSIGERGFFSEVTRDGAVSRAALTLEGFNIDLAALLPVDLVGLPFGMSYEITEELRLPMPEDVQAGVDTFTAVLEQMRLVERALAEVDAAEARVRERMEDLPETADEREAKDLAQAALDAALADLTGVTDAVDDAEAALAAATAGLPDAEAAVAAAEQAVADAEADAGADVAAVQAEIADLEDDVAELEAQVADLEDEVAAREADVAALAAEVADLEDDIAALEELAEDPVQAVLVAPEIADKQAQLLVAEAEQADAEQALADAEADLAAAQDDLANTEDELEEAQAQLDTVGAAVADAEQALVDAQDALADLAAEQAAQRAARDAARAALSAVQQVADEARDRFALAQLAYDAARDARADAGDELGPLRDDAVAMRAKLALLFLELQDLLDAMPDVLGLQETLLDALEATSVLKVGAMRLIAEASATADGGETTVVCELTGVEVLGKPMPNMTCEGFSDVREEIQGRIAEFLTLVAGRPVEAIVVDGPRITTRVSEVPDAQGFHSAGVTVEPMLVSIPKVEIGMTLDSTHERLGEIATMLLEREDLRTMPEFADTPSVPLAEIPVMALGVPTGGKVRVQGAGGSWKVADDGGDPVAEQLEGLERQVEESPAGPVVDGDTASVDGEMGGIDNDVTFRPASAGDAGDVDPDTDDDTDTDDDPDTDDEPDTDDDPDTDTDPGANGQGGGGDLLGTPGQGGGQNGGQGSGAGGSGADGAHGADGADGADATDGGDGGEGTDGGAKNGADDADGSVADVPMPMVGVDLPHTGGGASAALAGLLALVGGAVLRGRRS